MKLGLFAAGEALVGVLLLVFVTPPVVVVIWLAPLLVLVAVAAGILIQESVQ